MSFEMSDCMLSAQTCFLFLLSVSRPERIEFLALALVLAALLVLKLGGLSEVNKALVHFSVNVISPFFHSFIICT